MDFSKFKENVQRTTDNMKKSMSDASEKFQKSVKNSNAGNTAKDVLKKGQTAFENIKTKAEKTIEEQRTKNAMKKERMSDALSSTEDEKIVVSCLKSLWLIYLLMAVDRKITDEELEEFHSIGQAIDPRSFSECKETITDEIGKLMEKKTEDDDEYYDLIHDRVGLVLHTEDNSTECISGKTLIWDLLTVAYSDGDYSKDEKRLIRYIAKGIDIPNENVLEMEHTLRSLLAIKKEEEWLKNTDRKYNIVDERVKELNHRQDVIMQGVEALIVD